jgi:hypothetical protein
MRIIAICILLLGSWSWGEATAQSPEDLTRQTEALLDLGTVDLTRSEVKFRSGLEPSLLPFDIDESGMTVLKNPLQVFGKGKARMAGWYRLHFVTPEKLGKIAVPRTLGYALGIESNVQGAWEIYTYVNSKRAGGDGTGGIGAPRVVQGMNEPPHVWRSNAQLFTRPGDKVTVVILAKSSPFAESTDGFALRHLRLRFAGPHSAVHQGFFGAVGFNALGSSPTSGLLGVRTRLAKAKGEELTALQNRLKEPLARLDAVFKAAETADLVTLTKAMSAARDEINAALKK